MKQYKVTSEHIYLKSGLILKQDKDNPNYYLIGNEKLDFHIDIVRYYLEKGWIKEIDEKKWTDTDMTLFGAQCAQEWQEHKLLYVENELQNYLNNG